MTSVVTLKSCIRIADDKKNEAPEVKFLGSSSPRNLQGLSPFSSASLYLRMHSSTPCDILANSRDFTFSSRYSMISGGNVTVMYGLRFAIQDKILQKLINTAMTDSYSVRQNLTGELQNDRNNQLSESSEDHSDERRRMVVRHDRTGEGQTGDSPQILRGILRTSRSFGDGQSAAGSLGSQVHDGIHHVRGMRAEAVA